MAAKVEVKIGADASEFEKELAKVKALAGELGSRIGDSIKKIAVPAGIAAAAIGAIGLSAVKSYGQLQSLEKGLAAVAGSTDQAQKQLKRLREVAKLPGLGLEEAVRGSINLQAIGISAEQAERSILQFGNAIATVGKGRAELDRALYGLQQLANTDFPLGEDLNIIKDAIPQVSKLLTEAFGANRSDELAKLGITSQQVVETILTGLEKLPRVAGGVENAFENLQDGVTEAWQELGKAINDTVDFEGILNKIGDAIGGVVKWFRELDPQVRSAIVYIGAGTAAFFGLVAAMGAVIAIAPVVATALTAATGGIAALTAAIAVAAVYIVNNWDKIRTKILEAVAAIIGAVARLVIKFATLAHKLGLEKIGANIAKAAIAMRDYSNSITDKLEMENFIKMNEFISENAKKNADLLKGMADGGDKVTTSLNTQTDAAKRMSAALVYLNAQMALNGKLFKPQPVADKNLKALDRGNTIEIPQANITGIVDQAKAIAMDAAEAFNEYFSNNISGMIADGIMNITQSIGEAIGKGSNVIEAFGRSLFQTFGKFLSDFGEQLIAYGIAAGAFGKLMASIATLNPATIIASAGLAVAAGAALSVLGAAVAAAGSGTSQIAGQGSRNGTFTNGTVLETANLSDGSPKLFLSGGDIYMANKSYEAQIGRA